MRYFREGGSRSDVTRPYIYSGIRVQISGNAEMVAFPADKLRYPRRARTIAARRRDTPGSMGAICTPYNATY